MEEKVMNLAEKSLVEITDYLVNEEKCAEFQVKRVLRKLAKYGGKCKYHLMDRREKYIYNTISKFVGNTILNNMRCNKNDEETY